MTKLAFCSSYLLSFVLEENGGRSLHVSSLTGWSYGTTFSPAWRKPVTIQTGRMAICLGHLAGKGSNVSNLREQNNKRGFRSPQPDQSGLQFAFPHKSRTKNGLNTEICHSCNYILYLSKQRVAEVFSKISISKCSAEALITSSLKYLHFQFR